MSDEAYDPFKEEEATLNQFVRPRNLNTLTPGSVFNVSKFTQQRSKFRDSDGSYPLNTVAHYSEGGLAFQSILPKRFNNKSQQWLSTMNALINKKMGAKLAYYGMMGSGNEVQLLRHTEEIDKAKLETVMQVMAKQTPSPASSPMKRSASDSIDDNGPKVPRKENNDDLEIPHKENNNEQDN